MLNFNDHLQALRSSNNDSPYLLKDIGTGKTTRVEPQMVAPFTFKKDSRSME